MKSRYHRNTLLLLASVLLMSACGTLRNNRYQIHQDRAPDRNIDISQLANAVPRNEPRSKYGNPGSYRVNGRTYRVMKSSLGYRARGIASWYGKKFHGHRTSSGETYNMYAMTAAHKELPLPTWVRVTHLGNGRSVIVKVNDRGPFHANRIIDLSWAAAKKLGITASGTGVVEIEAIDPRHYQTHKTIVSTVEKQAATPTLQYHLYLQAGAFISRNNAQLLQQKLQAALQIQNIRAVYNADKHLYRVRIGPLANVDEADRLAKQINQRGLAQPHIVID
ncbi:MAG TPA: septal ring lytic transglycosylase RlpA family protein [Gammaproteobacteria bacterium]|nr:septal ring lytic transglycosylase RlpA family protein [Gammaproteobacteria bacterium]